MALALAAAAGALPACLPDARRKPAATRCAAWSSTRWSRDPTASCAVGTSTTPPACHPPLAQAAVRVRDCEDTCHCPVHVLVALTRGAHCPRGLQRSPPKSAVAAFRRRLPAARPAARRRFAPRRQFATSTRVTFRALCDFPAENAYPVRAACLEPNALFQLRNIFSTCVILRALCAFPAEITYPVRAPNQYARHVQSLMRFSR